VKEWLSTAHRRGELSGAADSTPARVLGTKTVADVQLVQRIRDRVWEDYEEDLKGKRRAFWEGGEGTQLRRAAFLQHDLVLGTKLQHRCVACNDGREREGGHRADGQCPTCRVWLCSTCAPVFRSAVELPTREMFVDCASAKRVKPDA